MGIATGWEKIADRKVLCPFPCLEAYDGKYDQGEDEMHDVAGTVRRYGGAVKRFLAMA